MDENGVNATGPQRRLGGITGKGFMPGQSGKVGDAVTWHAETPSRPGRLHPAYLGTRTRGVPQPWPGHTNGHPDPNEELRPRFRARRVGY
jgi:hypothetical protein